MNRRLIAMAVIAPMLCISLGFQTFTLYFVAYDMLAVGKVNFGAVFAYMASLPLSVPAYLVASAVVYNTNAALPMKWIHRYYFSLHAIVLLSIFIFPGSFSP
jgi:hypothetical protein